MKKFYFLIGAGACLIALLVFGIRQSNAQEDTPQPARVRTVVITTTQYTWQVVSNQTGRIICEVVVDEDREPTPDETLIACAEAIQPVVPTAEATSTTTTATPRPTPTTISGPAFLNSVSYYLASKNTFTRTVQLPMQELIIYLKVIPEPSTDPYFLIYAYEPEPEFEISRIEGKVNGVGFACTSSPCKVPLKEDALAEFWAVSTFGDESKHITAIFRVLFQNQLYNLVLTGITPSRTYRDSCADIWGIPDESRPEWATFLNTPDELNTNRKLFYLAEQLIRSGLVDVTGCVNGGLMSNGTPNACGMEKATEQMIRWQNQYDVPIWSAALDMGVPPRLIKTLLQVESQFWPANAVYYFYEYGLAQINTWGADVALRWDNELFQQVCNGLLFDCSRSYASLPTWLQATMRGGLVRSINSDCGNCQYGIDFAQAIHSVPTITRVIRANCYQADFILTENEATAKYEDMWRFTMASYHSGYDCLNSAISETKDQNKTINWQNVSVNLDDYCLGGSDYVNDFWDELTTFDTYRIQPPVPTPASAFVQPTAVPSPTPTPRRSTSTVRVSVYVDANQNNRFDAGEGVNDLDVEVRLSDGSLYTSKVVNGVALFDLTGKPIGARVVVTLPLLFRSEQALLPDIGELPFTFRLDQPVVPPVLP